MRADRGANMIEYVALVIVVAATIVAVGAVVLPTRVTGPFGAAVCRLVSADDAACGPDGAAGGEGSGRSGENAGGSGDSGGGAGDSGEGAGSGAGGGGGGSWGDDEGDEAGGGGPGGDDEQPTLPEATIEAMEQAAEDLQNGEFSGRGVCGMASLGAFAEQCLIVTEDNVGTLNNLGGIFNVSGAPGVAVEGFRTNAESLEDLSGYSTCMGGAVYGIGGTVCAGLNPDMTPTGVFTLVTSFGGPGGGNDAWVSFGHAEVNELMGTPELVADALDLAAEADGVATRIAACNQNLVCTVNVLAEVAGDLGGGPAEECACPINNDPPPGDLA